MSPGGYLGVDLAKDRDFTIVDVDAALQFINAHAPYTRDLERGVVPFQLLNTHVGIQQAAYYLCCFTYYKAAQHALRQLGTRSHERGSLESSAVIFLIQWLQLYHHRVDRAWEINRVAAENTMLHEINPRILYNEIHGVHALDGGTFTLSKLYGSAQRSYATMSVDYTSALQCVLRETSVSEQERSEHQMFERIFGQRATPRTTVLPPHQQTLRTEHSAIVDRPDMSEYIGRILSTVDLFLE